MLVFWIGSWPSLDSLLPRGVFSFFFHFLLRRPIWNCPSCLFHFLALKNRPVQTPKTAWRQDPRDKPRWDLAKLEIHIGQKFGIRHDKCTSQIEVDNKVRLEDNYEFVWEPELLRRIPNFLGKCAFWVWPRSHLGSSLMSFLHAVFVVWLDHCGKNWYPLIWNGHVSKRIFVVAFASDRVHRKEKQSEWWLVLTSIHVQHTLFHAVWHIDHSESQRRTRQRRKIYRPVRMHVSGRMGRHLFTHRKHHTRGCKTKNWQHNWLTWNRLHSPNSTSKLHYTPILKVRVCSLHEIHGRIRSSLPR